MVDLKVFYCYLTSTCIYHSCIDHKNAHIHFEPKWFYMSSTFNITPHEMQYIYILTYIVQSINDRKASWTKGAGSKHGQRSILQIDI